ncbi:MAG: sulfotransferase [Pirellulales bacterium]
MMSLVHAGGVAPPVIITGMHRSGTSLLASLFAGAGVSLGTRLIVASRGNERGHYEDRDFYEFHARVLEANGVQPEGFACVDEVAVPSAMRDAAAALVATKAAAGASWGWKDPRTALFLDFWGGILPEARFVFVFRSPWEVVDSLFRRGDELFITNPALAARVWLHYNQRITDFYRRNQSRCVLAEVSQVIADPAALFASVRQRLGVAVGEPAPRYEEQLLIRNAGVGREAIIAALLPEATDLYAEMQRLAGLPVPSRRQEPSDVAASIADHAIAEWSRGAIAETRSAALDLEKRALQGRLREVEDVGEELAALVQRCLLVESPVEAVRAEPAETHAA